MVALQGFVGPWFRNLFRFVVLFSYIIPIRYSILLCNSFWFCCPQPAWTIWTCGFKLETITTSTYMFILLLFQVFRLYIVVLWTCYLSIQCLVQFCFCYVFFSDWLHLYLSLFSLRVNLDMGKSAYGWMITKDENIPGTVVRTSTIPEELGRLVYLLTDKTGGSPDIVKKICI